MSINIKNKEAYRFTRQLAKLTRGSLTTAVTEAVRERLDKIRTERGIDLAARLLSIGKDCAPHLQEPYRTTVHAEFFTTSKGWRNDHRYVRNHRHFAR